MDRSTNTEGRGPGDVQYGAQFSDPGAVGGVDLDSFLAGKQGVLGVDDRRLLRPRTG
ncbi:hypothetical protein HW126_18950 [Salinispora sp. H7-4]|nr:hypothetical protein [Salinispora sp. H7-4]